MKKIILGILALVLLAGGTIATVAARSNPYEPAPVVIAEATEATEVLQVQIAPPVINTQDIRVQVVGSGLEAMLAQRTETVVETRLYGIGTIDIIAQLEALDIAELVTRIRDFDREIIVNYIRDFDINIVTDFIREFDMDAAVSHALELIEQFGYSWLLEDIDIDEYVELFNNNRWIIVAWIENFAKDYLIREIENFDIEIIIEWLENLDIDALIEDIRPLLDFNTTALDIRSLRDFDTNALVFDLDIDILMELDDDFIRQQIQIFGFGDYEDELLELFNRFVR